MAVIGSRANGTRVPKGGGLGPASDFSQNGFFNPDAPQPASERRDVTFLGRPALPAAPDPARASGSGSGLGSEANSLADVDLPPLDARSDLFVKSTTDRARREWFDRLAQDERALDPLAATGFAGGIKQRFEDFTAKTLGDMPETLRPHIADSLVRVGREIETRAADFETTASPVGVFNQTKQALDDLTATTAHERFDAHRLLIEGQKRIQDAPLNEGAKDILRGYFLADLPVKTALSHIDDDPDDALAALEAAENRKGGGSGNAKEDGGRAEAPSPRNLADGADGVDGEFDPALFYADIAPEVRSGLKATARITSARRRESARIETTKSLEQGIAANTVTAAQIETANLETDDKVRLHAQLKTARAEDERDAEAAERYITDPKSFDRNNPEDRAMADRGFGILAGERGASGSTLAADQDGEAIDIIGLSTGFMARSGFMPEAAIAELQHLAINGSPEDRAQATEALQAANIPLPDATSPSTLTADVARKSGVDGISDLSSQNVDTSIEKNGVSDEADTTLGKIAEVADSINRLFDEPQGNGRSLGQAIEEFERIKSDGSQALIENRVPSLEEGHRQVSEALDNIFQELGKLSAEAFSKLRDFVENSENLTDLEKQQIGKILAATEKVGAPLLSAVFPIPGRKRPIRPLTSEERRQRAELDAVRRENEERQRRNEPIRLEHVVESKTRVYSDVRTSIVLRGPAVMSKKVLERGFPLGFDDAGEFLTYKKGLLDALPAQHSDVIVGMRGSSIHGNKFIELPNKDNQKGNHKRVGAHTGAFFDTGKETSDWDIFIVSPELFRAAKEEKLVTRKNAKYSNVIKKQFEYGKLGLEDFGKAIRGDGKRGSSVIIFESLDGLRSRGSYMKFD